MLFFCLTDMRHTHKHAVHCRTKFYKLNEPTGSD